MLNRERVTGRQLTNVFEDGAGRDRTPESEDLIQSLQIQFARYPGVGKNGLNLRSKDEGAPNRGVEQRPHTEAIAGEEKFALSRIPYRKGPLPIHPPDAVLAFVLVQTENHFGIRLSCELMAGAEQFVAQLYVVEDLSVKGYPDRFVWITHGLLPGSDVDDAEAGVGQADSVVGI